MTVDREKYLARQRRYNRSEKGRARSRRRRQSLIDAGLCTRCGRPADLLMTLCRACADAQALYKRERYATDVRYYMRTTLANRRRSALKRMAARNPYRDEFGEDPPVARALDRAIKTPTVRLRLVPTVHQR